jgi:ABC-2 type transport system permease protein
MNGAVVRKSLRDARSALVLLPLGIVLFNALAVRLLVEAARDLEQLRTWLARPFVQFFIRNALGGELAGELTPTAMITFALGHPLYYALSWTLLITIGTNVIAGELGRGTADLLLTLPLRRRTIYLSTSVAWFLGAVLVSVAPLPGLWLGQQFFTLPQPLEFARLWPVVPNLLALHLCTAGLTMMVSALVTRRGQAVAIVLAALLVSDLLKTLAQFWDALRPVSVIGLLHYYQPLPIVRSGVVPLGHVGVLLAAGAAAWLVGLWHFSRRDIPAV